MSDRIKWLRYGILIGLLMIAIAGGSFAETVDLNEVYANQQDHMQFVSLENLVQQVASGSAVQLSSLNKENESTWSFKGGLLTNWTTPVVKWNGVYGIWTDSRDLELLGTLMYTEKGRFYCMTVGRRPAADMQTAFVAVQDQTNLSSLPFDYRLILVNKDSEIDLNYKTALVTNKQAGIRGLQDIKISKLIAKDLKALFDEAKRTKGYNLYCTSGLRTVEKQRSILNREVNRLTSRGVKNPVEVARRTINLPRQSEHHTGFAVDIVSTKALTLNAFKTSKEAVWAAQNAPTYGFILRYPPNKRPITGIDHEQWHFRYVGKDFAKLLTKEKLTLEEWVEQGKKGRIYTDLQGKKHLFLVVSIKDKQSAKLPKEMLESVTCYYINTAYMGIDLQL